MVKEQNLSRITVDTLANDLTQINAFYFREFEAAGEKPVKSTLLAAGEHALSNFSAGALPLSIN